MKIHIGCGRKPFPGYVNIDVQRFEGADQKGTATHLPGLATGSVDLVFLNAVFEHLYPAQQPLAIAEWKRVLKPEGRLLVTGIPDFERLAALYVKRAPGHDGPRFDLNHLYRYTHGAPEEFSPAVWGHWREDHHPEQTPKGWLPQLHKSLFDTEYLSELLRTLGLHFSLFRYDYPGEKEKITMGFIASMSPGGFAWQDLAALKKLVSDIPLVESMADVSSLEWVEEGKRGDSFVAYVTRHAGKAFPSLAERVRGKLTRTFRSLSPFRR